MPLSDDQKRKIIAAHGLSPDAYDVDETSMELVPKTQVANAPVYDAPAVDLTSQENVSSISDKREKYSALGTAGRAGAKAVVPTLAGAGAAAGIAALLAPETGGLSLAALPFLIGGSAAAGMGAGYAQEKVLDKYAPDFQQAAAESRMQNPVAGFAGDFIPAVATMQFNPAKLTNAVRGLGKVPAGTASRMTAGEIGALGEAGVGAGASLAIDTARKLAGQDVSWQEMAADAALGATLNTPRKWTQSTRAGRALFPASTLSPDERFEVPNLDLAEARLNATEGPRLDRVQTENLGKMNEYEASLNAPYEAPKRPAKIADPYAEMESNLEQVARETFDERARQQQLDRFQQQQTARQLDEARMKQVFDNIGQNAVTEPLSQAGFDDFKNKRTARLAEEAAIAEKQAAEVAAKQATEARNLQRWNNIGEAPIEQLSGNREPGNVQVGSRELSPMTRLEQELSDLQQKYKEVTAATPDAPQIEHPYIAAQQTRVPMPGGVVVQDNPVIMMRDAIAQKRKEIDAVRAAQPNRDLPINTKFQEGAPTAPTAEPQLTQADVNELTKQARQRGFSVELAKDVAEGKARGVWIQDAQGNRKIRVGVFDATKTTVPHEIGHDVFTDIQGSGRRVDKRQAGALLKAFGGSEEALVQGFAERYPNADKSKLMQWVKAVKANVKTIARMNLSPDDATALMRYRLETDAPWNWKPAAGADGAPAAAVVAGETAAAPVEEKAQAKFATMSPTTQADAHAAKLEGDTILAEAVPRLRMDKAFKSTTDAMPILGPDVDKLPALLPARIGIQLRDTFNELADVNRATNAKYWEPISTEVRKLSREQDIALGEHLIAEDFANARLPLNDPALQPAYDIIRAQLDSNADDRIAMGMKVRTANGKFRDVIKDPSYTPPVIKREFLQILTDLHPGDKAFDETKKLFVDYNVANGAAPATAEANFNNLIRSLGDNDMRSSYYGAARLEAGAGIPAQLREASAGKLMEQYFRRMSRDMSWFSTAEQNHNVMAALGKTTTYDGKPLMTTQGPVAHGAVRGIMDQIEGKNRNNSNLNKAAKLATTVMLGPVTAAKDIVSSYAGALAYVPKEAGMFNAAIAGMRDLKTHWDKAKKLGINPDTYAPLDDAFDLSTINKSRFDEILQAGAKLSTRQAGERLSRALTYGISEFAIKAHEAAALGGSGASAKFLKGLANGGDWRKLGSDELAARLTQLRVGTYDYRQLPSWALAGPFEPMFRLARWNLGQSNVFYKNVVAPARKGNYTPLMRTLFGTAVGGAMAAWLQDNMSGKHSPVPDFMELYAAGKDAKADAWMYRLMQIAAMSGSFGIVGEFPKLAFDAKFNNLSSGITTFPVVELATNVGEDTLKAGAAIAEGEDIADVAGEYLKRLMQSNVQLYRVLANAADDSNETQQRSDRSELRRFKIATGKPVPTIATNMGNPFMDIDAKKFKATDEITKEEIEQLVTARINKARRPDGSIDSEVLKKSLSSLRRIPTTTMPSFKEDTNTAAQYIDYLKSRYGDERAAEYVRRYLKQKALNEAKTRAVPSIK